MLQQFVVTVDYTMTRNVTWIGPKEWTNLVCVTTWLYKGNLWGRWRGVEGEQGMHLEPVRQMI